MTSVLTEWFGNKNPQLLKAGGTLAVSLAERKKKEIILKKNNDLMVSINVINSVLSVIRNLALDKKSIGEMSENNLIETENALKVLISHGYVLKSKSKGFNNGEKYKFTYYTASESAKEILNNGGFTKQLSMKEKSKTSIKNKLSIKDSNVTGQINQGQHLEKNKAIISKQSGQLSENEKQQSIISKWFWLFLIPLVVGIIVIAVQFKWFK